MEKNGRMKNFLKKEIDLNLWVFLVLAFFSVSIYGCFWFYFNSLAKMEVWGIASSFPVNSGDSSDYATLGDNLLKYHFFSNRTEAPFVPTTHRVPGYPFFLAAFKFIFGSYHYFPFIQILMAILTAFLIFKIGQKMGSGTAGFIAGLFYLIDPAAIFHTSVILSESVFNFLFVLGIYITFFHQFKRPFLAEACAGFIFGVSTLVRPVVTPLLLVALCFFYFLFKKKEIGFKQIFSGIFILIFIYSLIVFPWVIRNKMVSGNWGISSNSSYTLFRYFVPNYLAYRDNISMKEAMDRLVKEAGPLKYGSSHLADSPAIDKITLGYIKNDFFGYAKFHLIKSIPFFLSSGTTLFSPQENSIDFSGLIMRGEYKSALKGLAATPWITLEKVGWLLIVILAFCSVFLKKNRLQIFIFLCLIIYFALITGSIAYARYRLVATPFIFILASLSAVFIFEKIKIKFDHKK